MASFFYTILIIGAIGLLLGIILSLASKFFSVPTDERVEKIRECLPGANCGACGFSGCDGYAEALAKGNTEPNLCTPGGETAAKQLSEVLGVEVTATKKIAFIHCNHGLDKAINKFAYSGALSCSAANLLYGGELACKYGCLGFGDCQKVCENGAIEYIDGNMVVCKEKCGGCGKCAAACPKGLISIIPADKPFYVACSNKEKGAKARKQCTAACIGCKKCEKVCAHNAIEVKDNLAVIDASKCVSCGECAAACPQKCILIH